VEGLYKEFGRRLRNRRIDSKMTQNQVAERVGLTRTSITNIERGRQHIALHQLFLLASAVGVAPDELLPDQKAALEELVPKRALKVLDKDEEGRDFAARVLVKSSLPPSAKKVGAG
jgi:transcriptional regulator with XRE-family HTH domain